MYDKRKKIEKNWRLVIILSITLFIVIISQDIAREIVVFNQELGDLKTDLVNELKDGLEEEVEFRVTEINRITDNMNSQFDRHIIETISPLKIIVDRTIELNVGKTPSEIEMEVIETIKQFDQFEEEHHYSLMNKNGTLIYDGELDQISNADISTIKDDMNRHYLQELLTQIELSEDNKSIVYAFFNESDETTQYGYAGLQIEDTDYVVFTIGNMNMFQSKQLEEYYSSLADFYETKERSIYIFGKDGTVYLQKNTDFIGMNVNDITDPLFVTAFQKILDESDEIISGHFEVDYYKNLIEGEIGNRLTYVRNIGSLDLIVGYSIDSATYDYIIEDFQSNSLNKNLVILIPIYLAVIAIGVTLSRLIVNNNKLSNQLFEEEENLYKIFSDITEDIIIITDKTGQIIFSNKLGVKTIFSEGVITPINLDDIMMDEEGFKVLVGINENYYVKSSVTEVVYGGQDCDLIIVTDVTEKVTNERKLEKMTLIDDLTGLGNRRLLVRDYKEYVLPLIKESKIAHLSMIDLDNFKQANDIYGHSFGDDVLVKIGEIFREHSTDDIIVYRVGGDEFAMIALNHSRNDVMQILRKMKNKISTFNYGKKVNIGFSAGVVEINIKDQKRRLSDYYELADSLLYEAKEEGKDKIKLK